MTRHPLPTRGFAAITCGLALIEWLLFELMRAPYRPPDDMTTFLGTEKYGVLALMFGLAGVGLALLSWWAARSTWTKQDIVGIVLIVTALTGAITYVVVNPLWPVTPLEWVLR